MSENSKVVRKNMWMSKSIAQWYEEQSKKTGMSQSSIMVMALSQYIDQQKMLNMSNLMQQLSEKLEDNNPKKE